MGLRTDCNNRGRPRGFDHDAVVDRVVEVFWQHGYGGTTTRLLEAELGLNQSSLYNTFGSKRLLLEEALDRYQERLEHVVFLPCETNRDGLAAMDELVAQLHQWVTSGPQRGCLLLNLEAELATDLRFVDRVRGHRARLLAVLTGASENSDIAQDRALGLPLAMHAALIGMMVMSRLDDVSQVDEVRWAIAGQLVPRSARHR